MNCEASRQRSRGMPDLPSTIYAEEGTVCHLAMADILEGKVTHRQDVIGMQYERATLTEAIYLTKVVPALQIFEQHYQDVVDYRVETRVDLPIPGAFGTADIVGEYLSETKRLLVLDWKFGDGIMVSPVGNDQLLYYAAGTLCAFPEYGLLPDRTPVDIVVVQPARDTAPEDAHKVWNTTVGHVRNWYRTYARRIEQSDRKDSRWPATSGGHCQFCPAKVACPEHLEHTDYDLARVDWDSRVNGKDMFA